MEYEILTLQDAQMIGRSRKIAFNNPSECQKFWGEYVERIVKPVYLEGRAPDEFQKFAGLSMQYDAVLRPYPQLLGVYDAKQKSMLWDGREKPIGLVELDCREHSVAEDMYALVPEFNANGFKGGKSRALEAYRITLCDGAAVVLQGAHALMDGYTFYRIAGDWGKITSGTPVDAMTVDRAAPQGPAGDAPRHD